MVFFLYCIRIFYTNVYKIPLSGNYAMAHNQYVSVPKLETCGRITWFFGFPKPTHSLSKFQMRPNGTGLFTYMKSETWPHEQGDM